MKLPKTASELFDFNLTEDEIEAVNQFIPIRSYVAGTVLLREGQVADESYFNIKGLVRAYYLVEGEEKTTDFFEEGQSVASLYSYVKRVPSKYYLQCVEDCVLAVMNYHTEDELIRKVPKLESVCRVTIEEDHGRQQEILGSYIMKSPEERYLDILQKRPNLINRVPQYHLASYLGVKPESLSRIRKRLSKKD